MTELVVGRLVFGNSSELKEKPMLMDKMEVVVGGEKVGEIPVMEMPAKDKLKGFIERVERLEEEKRELSSDITDIYNIAKSDGFDVKAMKQVIRLRRKEKAERDDELNALETYMSALGM